MSWIFRYTGAVITVLCAYLVSVGYKKYIKRAEREAEGFLSLIDYMRSRIDCYLSTVSEIFSDFEDVAIEPFLSAVREGKSPKDALASVEKDLAIGREGREILHRLFSLVCGEYKAGVISVIDSSEASFSEYYERSKEEGRKNVRLLSALLLGASLGVVILLI